MHTHTQVMQCDFTKVVLRTYLKKFLKQLNKKYFNLKEYNITTNIAKIIYICVSIRFIANVGEKESSEEDRAFRIGRKKWQ